MTQKNRCGRCEAVWFGLSIAHCSMCHHTFTNYRTFDLHRAAQFRLDEPREVKTRKGETEMRQRRIETRPAGQCYDPLESGLVLNDRGYWSSPPGNYWENRTKENTSAHPEQGCFNSADQPAVGVDGKSSQGAI